MTTIDHHDARGPEETMHDLPPVVPAGSARRRPATGLRRAGMSVRSPAEDAREVPQPDPRLCHRLDNCPARDASTTTAGAAAIAGAIEPTSLGCRERPLRSAIFFQAEDGIRDTSVTGVQTCALPI